MSEGNSSGERLQQREHSYRMTIARLVDAIQRYPDDLPAATLAAKDELRRAPLWTELDEAVQS